MSILITVHCEYPVDQWSICAERLLTGAKTVDAALERARAAGWSDTGALCPRHAGRS